MKLVQSSAIHTKIINAIELIINIAPKHFDYDLFKHNCVAQYSRRTVTSVQSSRPVRVLSERRSQRSKQSDFHLSLSLSLSCSHPSLQHNASQVTINTREAILHVCDPHNALGTVLVNQTSPRWIVSLMGPCWRYPLMKKRDDEEALLLCL